MAQLLLNPRKRSRKARKSRKHRTAAQRAATRRMIAANRSRRGGGRRRAVVVHANPVRRSRRRYRRNPVGGSRARRHYNAIRSSGAFNMLKSGAMMGVGAVAVDLLFGQLARFLPASMAVPQNADGSTNWLYFATKAAIAVGVGAYGRKVIPAKYAEAAAIGSLSILAYSIARSMVPSSLAMGAYVNPARVVNQQRLNGMRAYLPTSSAAARPMVGPRIRAASAVR